MDSSLDCVHYTCFFNSSLRSLTAKPAWKGYFSPQSAGRTCFRQMNGKHPGLKRGVARKMALQNCLLAIFIITLVKMCKRARLLRKEKGAGRFLQILVGHAQVHGAQGGNSRDWNKSLVDFDWRALPALEGIFFLFSGGCMVMIPRAAFSHVEEAQVLWRIRVLARTGKQILSMLLPRTLSMKASMDVCWMNETQEVFLLAPQGSRFKQKSPLFCRSIAAQLDMCPFN